MGATLCGLETARPLVFPAQVKSVTGCLFRAPPVGRDTGLWGPFGSRSSDAGTEGAPTEGPAASPPQEGLLGTAPHRTSHKQTKCWSGGKGGAVQGDTAQTIPHTLEGFCPGAELWGGKPQGGKGVSRMLHLMAQTTGHEMRQDPWYPVQYP